MSKPLRERLKEHHSNIVKLLSISGAPGLSLGVFDRGRIVRAARFGRESLDSDGFPDDESIYYMASMFKMVTACVISRLVVSGRLP